MMIISRSIDIIISWRSMKLINWSQEDICLIDKGYVDNNWRDEWAGASEKGSQMIFEKLSYRLDENVFAHRFLENLLDLCLTLRLQDSRLLLEQQTHTVQRYYFQRLCPYYPIQQKKKLLKTHVPDKTVKHPGKDYLQRLHLKLLELYHQLFLAVPKQLFKENAETCVGRNVLRMESGREETVLRRTK